MKIGISALLFNIEEALEICKKIDEINHIEIGIDNLYECKKLHEYKDAIDNLGLSIGIHLPMELNSCENIEYISKSWINFIKEIDSNLTCFDIKYFNFHLGYVISDRLNKNRNKYLDNSIKFIENINIKSNAKLSIENVYSNRGDFSNVGNKTYDFEYIFNRVNNKNVCFCYDTGHYLINNDNYIERLNDKINVIHLSDNDGISDMHIGIGKGILHESHVKKVLNLNPDYLVLEINYKHIDDSINKLSSIIEEV